MAEASGFILVQSFVTDALSVAILPEVQGMTWPYIRGHPSRRLRIATQDGAGPGTRAGR